MQTSVLKLKQLVVYGMISTKHILQTSLLLTGLACCMPAAIDLIVISPLNPLFFWKQASQQDQQQQQPQSLESTLGMMGAGVSLHSLGNRVLWIRAQKSKTLSPPGLSDATNQNHRWLPEFMIALTSKALFMRLPFETA